MVICGFKTNVPVINLTLVSCGSLSVLFSHQLTHKRQVNKNQSQQTSSENFDHCNFPELKVSPAERRPERDSLVDLKITLTKMQHRQIGRKLLD